MVVILSNGSTSCEGQVKNSVFQHQKNLDKWWIEFFLIMYMMVTLH